MADPKKPDTSVSDAARQRLAIILHAMSKGQVPAQINGETHNVGSGFGLPARDFTPPPADWNDVSPAYYKDELAFIFNPEIERYAVGAYDESRPNGLATLAQVVNARYSDGTRAISGADAANAIGKWIVALSPYTLGYRTEKDIEKTKQHETRHHAYAAYLAALDQQNRWGSLDHKKTFNQFIDSSPQTQKILKEEIIPLYGNDDWRDELVARGYVDPTKIGTGPR